MFKKFLALLRGLDFPPALVGLLRGAVEAGAMALFIEAAILFGQTEWSSTWWAPVAWIAVRQAEGIADHIDPAKKRAP